MLTLRGGRPIPAGYPLHPEDLATAGDCIADVPAEKLQALVDFYGDADPPGEEPPARLLGFAAAAAGVDYLDFSTAPHGGQLKLLPEHDQQLAIQPVGMVDHTIVGSGLGAFYYFRDSTGTESHFIVLKTGMIWQLMSLRRSADAQVRGNYWTADGRGHGFLSVETEDNGDPANDPWTAEQLAALRWLHETLARIFGWRRQRTPAPYGPDAAGLGRHGMWLNTRWMAADGTTPWTTAAWKPCPAAARIRQWDETLLPAYLAGSTNPSEDDVSADEVWGYGIRNPETGMVMPASERLLDVQRRALAGQQAAEQALAKVTALGPTITRVAHIEAMLATGDVPGAVAKIKEMVTDQADDAERILGRLDVLPLNLTTEQTAQLAAALDLDEERVAAAVRREFAGALAGQPAPTA